MATAGLDSDELDLIVTVTNMDEDGQGDVLERRSGRDGSGDNGRGRC